MRTRIGGGVVFVTICGVLIAMATAQEATFKRAPENRYLGHVRHVVLLKFKEGTKDEDVKKAEDAFRALKEKIPVVEALEWGTNVSPEKLNQGFTHCFLLTFGTEQDRDTYLKHPEHKAFGGVLHPHLDKVLVIDFVSKE